MAEAVSRTALVGPFPPYRGGISQFDGRLRTALEESGRPVLPISFSRQYPTILFPGTSQIDPDSAEGESASAAPERVLDSVNPVTWWKTGKRIAKAKTAVIAYWTPHLAPALAVAARVSGIPCVGLIHNARAHDRSNALGDALTRRFLRQLRGVVTLSPRVLDDVRELGYAGQAIVSPHPVYDHYGDPVPKAAARRRLGLNPDARILLCFGLVRPYKGFDLALKALPALIRAEPKTQLIMAGEAYGEEVEMLLGSLPEETRSRVTRVNRFMEGREIPDFYSAADILLLPYRGGTQSGALAVAAHFGLPAVVSDIPGIAEPIHSFGMGRAFRTGDHESLARAIQDLSSGRAMEKARAGALRMKVDRSWDGFAADLNSFLGEVAKGIAS